MRAIRFGRSGSPARICTSQPSSSSSPRDPLDALALVAGRVASCRSAAAARAARRGDPGAALSLIRDSLAASPGKSETRAFAALFAGGRWRGNTQHMPRSMWTGAISFGMVTVPVKLYSAINRKTVRFHQLNGKIGRAHRPEARRPAERRGGPLRGHRQGLRDRARPLRGDRAGRARGARSRRRPRRSRSRTSSSSPRSTRSSTTTPTTSRPGPAAPSPTDCCSKRCARPARSRSPAS